jgi:nitroimidazol reductase NimA-like FMN-containing flavoprotein (pyridoxamine 5'-phosphate oxidase superfamily)
MSTMPEGSDEEGVVAMPRNEPTSERNLDGYGAPPIEWARVRDVLDGEITQAPETGGPGRHTSWLATINPDGSPHVMPLGVVRVDGTWYFSSGPGTRKSANITRDPRCVVSVATHPFDLVVEGTAERVVDAAELQAVAETFAAQGWQASVAGDALTAEYSAPAAGPPPWSVYRVVPSTVFALGTAEPYGATRFDL